MSKVGERILRSARAARAYAHGEVMEGFVAHVMFGDLVPDDASRGAGGQRQTSAQCQSREMRNSRIAYDFTS